MSADGRIVIDTAINTSGFQAGTKQMEAAAKRTAGTLNKIGESARAGFEKAMQVQGGGAQVASYAALEQELNQVTGKIDALIEKQQRFVEIGGSQDSMTFKGMEYDIEQLRARMVELQAQKEALGTPVSGGGKNAFNGIWSGVQRVATGFRNAASAVKDYMTKSRKVGSSANIGAKGMATMALGVSSLLGAFMKLRQGLVEGLKNLSKFDKGTNTAMSSLKSSLTQVKNSLATAFSPILTAIAPAINTLLSMISSALNAIGEFMAALTGQSTYTRATAVQEDYAASLDGTAKAAKDAQKQMSGLDEMTTWQSKDSGGGSGSGSGSKAFETVDVKNSPFANFAEQLKERFENQDYRGVGEAVAEKVNEAVSSWDSTGAGKSLSDKIVGVLEGAVGFLEGTNWQGIGNQIENFVTAIDWSKITNLIFEGLGAVVGALLGLAYGLVKDAIVTVQDWMYWAGQATADGLFEGIWNAVKDIGKWIHDNIFKPFAEGFCKAFGIHSPSTVAYGWGQDVVQGFVNGIKSIPQKVSTYFTALKTKITTVCNSITGWISGTFVKNWTSKFSQLKNPVTTLGDNVKSIFNNKIKSMLNTTNSFVSGTFSENWKKAWESVKKIFSSVFSTFLSIAKAPINGIIGLINGLIDALNKAITGINKIKVDIPNWVPLVGGNSIGFNIPKLSKIPYLASGAVIPPNAPFTAMLGDQRHGTNLEAPEGLIRQIVREESGQGSYTFVAQINRRTIFKEIIDEGKLQQARTGKNPFVLA